MWKCEQYGSQNLIQHEMYSKHNTVMNNMKTWVLCVWSVGVRSSTSVVRLSEHMWAFSAALCVVVFFLVAASLGFQKKWDRDRKRKQHRCGGTKDLFIWWSNYYVDLLYDDHFFGLQMIHLARALTWLCSIWSNGLPFQKQMCNTVTLWLTGNDSQFHSLNQLEIHGTNFIQGHWFILFFHWISSFSNIIS